MLFYNTRLRTHSRQLRKNMTETEIRLWSKIRRRQLKGCQFYRQRIIGNYIVDFYCPRARLVIEVDGGQHYGGREAGADAARDAYMAEHGLRVLRFSDREVFDNTDGVLEKIHEAL